jgi:glutamine amidotransferase
MQSLQDRDLVSTLKQLEVPFLGICLGLQLLFEQSAEDETPCLGLFQGGVTRFESSSLKVPHMGWNEVLFAASEQADLLFSGVPQDSFFYFVHSYYVVPRQPEVVLASTQYGTAFTCAVQLHNFWGVQFHPERSGELGLQVLHNFVTRIAGIGC